MYRRFPYNRYHAEDAMAYLTATAERAKAMGADTGESIMRTFATGATRHTDSGKPDYEGYLSPLVIRRFGDYMTQHRVQADGELRASDNWQKGIPKEEYIKSTFRHFVDLWLGHRAASDGRVSTRYETDRMEEALCGMFFNIQGYLHELLKDKPAKTNATACHSGDSVGYARAGFTAKL